MIKDDCIFCKLANGIIPTNKIYEDGDFTVILDLSPANTGHALIIPKQHYDNLLELDDEIASKVLPLAKRIASVMKEVLNADGINIVQNNGVAANQTIPHFHTHIIPRYDNDGCGIIWPQKEPDADELAALAEKLAAKL
ncbi:MAG: HIT family protein [Eubacterium sp.]|nr:HIT family protein [Eubacterium sp.]